MQQSTEFNILDPNLPIKQNYLLEASAGTGKTFAIEHLVLRLLLDKEPLELQEILLVTFTRASTRELKERLHKRLHATLRFLEDKGGEAPPYLNILNEEDKQEAIWKIRRALALFEEAQIFTIHGFSSRMLAEQGDFSRSEELKRTHLLRLVQDVLVSELTPENYAKEQVKILLSKHRQDALALSKELARMIESDTSFAPQLSNRELLAQIQQTLTSLKNTFDPLPHKIQEDFTLLSKHYKGLCNTSGVLKSDIWNKLLLFSTFFDGTPLEGEKIEQLIATGPDIAEAFNPENKKARSKSTVEPTLHYPGFFDRIRNELTAPLQQLSDPHLLLLRLAATCQKRLREWKKEHLYFTQDDLLRRMERALSSSDFCEGVRKRYRAVLIDEFQDTDPIQWNIFSTLFLKEQGRHLLYLVGDPKQSIYAFRSADIYTYLEAAKHLGEDTKRSLSHNFRSTPSLIAALNALFSGAGEKGLFPLPRLQIELPYSSVKAGSTAPPLSGTPLQFFYTESPLKTLSTWPREETEREYLLPYIAQEVMRLHQEEQVPWEQIAILVKDRYQAERAARFLSNLSIPVHIQRNKLLTDHPIFSATKKVLQASLKPQDTSLIRAAALTPLLRFSSDTFTADSTEENSILIQLMQQFLELRPPLEKGDIATWSSQLLKVFGEAEEKDREVFHQLVDRLIEHQKRTGARGQQLLQAFTDLEWMAFNEDPASRLRQESNINALPLITIHGSKGLEFEVVFALGAATRSPPPKELIRVAEELTLSKGVNDPLTQAVFAEADAEKLRQLYVALTRAKRKLYIPLVFSSGESKAPSPGTASPLELFLAKWCGDGSYQAVQALSLSKLKERLEAIPECALSICSGMSPHPYKQAEVTPHHAGEPPKAILSAEPLQIASFSSLSSSSHKVSGILKSENNLQELPSGKELGVLIHGILEEIPWGAWELSNVESLEKLVEKSSFQSQLEGFWKPWKKEIYQLLAGALFTPFDLGSGAPLILGSLSAQEVKREMEFLFPRKEHLMIKGFMDLLFRFEGRYYLLDWKTNRLENYLPETLKEAVKEQQYDLQASLYTEALKRMLALFDPRPFEELFGGAFVLFLRGSPKGEGIIKIAD